MALRFWSADATEKRHGSGEPELKELISRLLDFNDRLSAPFVGREEEARAISLALVSGENVLFVGPPGTAKSDIALMATKLICGARFFKTQLNVYTEPPQLFGPIDIKALRRRFRKPVYRHVTTGKLPESDIAFIDEIFRGGRIRDMLLSIMNEKAMFNGKVIKVPLRTVMGATNFISEEEEDQAMKDRFVLRKFVNHVSGDKETQSDLLHAAFEGEFGDSKKVREPALSLQDLDLLYDYISGMNVFKLEDKLIEIFTQHLSGIDVTLSDRTKGKVLKLAASSALIDGRDHVHFEDLMVLKYILPNDEDEVAKISGMLEDNISPRAFQKQIKDLKENLSTQRLALEKEVPRVTEEELEAAMSAIEATKKRARLFMEMTSVGADAEGLLRYAEELSRLCDSAMERRRSNTAQLNLLHRAAS